MKENNRSAIWGGGTIGLFIGVILAIIRQDIKLILWAIVVGIILGIFAEALGKLSDKLRK